MDEILAELLVCLPIFVIEVVLLMLITETIEREVGGSSVHRFWDEFKILLKLNSRQKNRLKALLILFVGVSAGTLISYEATEIHAINSSFNDWLFKGMSQMAYAFAAAITAVYIRDGYVLDQKNDDDKQETRSVK